MTPRSPSSPGSVVAIAAAASRSTLNVPTRLTMTVRVNAPRSCGSPVRPTVRCAQRMPAVLLQVEDGDGGTASGECPGGGLPQPGGSAGDQGCDVEALHGGRLTTGPRAGRAPRR